MQDLPKQELIQLVNLIAQGDNTAISTLYDHYSPMIKSYILAKTNHGRFAEEATNDVFLKAIPKIKTFNFTSKLSTWLIGYAFNVIRDYEKKSRKYQHETTWDDTHAETVPSNALPLEALLEDQEQIEILNTCVSRLGNELKATYSLMYVSGFSISEAAVQLDTKEGTIKSRLFNLRAQLKQCVENLYR